MYCPFCTNEETKVLESRVQDNSMRRRRECLKCSNRFTTYERAVFNLTVLKKNNSIQPFVVQKISQSIQNALGKSDEVLANNITRKVEQKVLRKKTNPIKSTDIGKFVLQELKKHDKMAFVRFASIYKEIDDPKLLEREIDLVT